jgi:hypothetical protein
MNGLQQTVTVHEAAVATKNGEGLLVDADINSTVGGTLRSGERIPVKTVDFFEALAPEPIDILKLDIEGAEYSLLSDPRFQNLSIGFIVMEWHRTSDFPDSGPQWCESRLAELGFAVERDADPRSQIIRALRR